MMTGVLMDLVMEVALEVEEASEGLGADPGVPGDNMIPRGASTSCCTAGNNFCMKLVGCGW